MSEQTADAILPIGTIGRKIGHKEYHLYGANAALVRWVERSPLAGDICAAARVTVDELFVALGGQWPQERVPSGKRLIEKLWHANPFLGPYPFLDTLSQFEFDRTFYAKYRDHVCHQLKVYLLGLYAYEQCPRLKDHLDQSFAVPASAPEKTFALRWLVTSVYHDVGYVLENAQADPVSGEAWIRTRDRLNAVLETPLAYVPAFSELLRPQQESQVVQRHEIFRPRVEVPSDLDRYRDDDATRDLLSLLDAEAVRAGLGQPVDGRAVLRGYYEHAQKQPLPGRRPFRDHGVTSALLLLYAWRDFQRYVTRLAALMDEPLLASAAAELRDLAGTLRNPDTVEAVRVAAAAMALHNVTPRDWSSAPLERELLNAGVTIGKFQICLSDPARGTPLAFLLGLVDTLQDWDRPRFRSPKAEDEQIRTDQDMSISARDGKLLLYLAEDDRDYRQPASHPGSRFATACRILHEYLAPADIDALIGWDDRVQSPDDVRSGEASRPRATSASVMPRAAYIVRRGEVEDIVERQLDVDPPEEGAWRAVVLRGMPGAGKSMLAAAVAHKLAQAMSMGGVLWARVGPPERSTKANDRRLAGAVEAWLDDLGAPRPSTPVSGLDDVLHGLKPRLRSSAAAVVLDDVWDPEDARRLLAVVGPACRVLITTRIPDVARLLGLPEHEVPPMSHEEGVLLLNRGPASSASDREALARIVQLFGALPVALDVLGSLKPRSQSWKSFADSLEIAPSRLRLLRGASADSMTLEEDRKRLNAQFSFRLSFNHLDAAAREAFLWLGALRPGALFTSRTVATLCRVSDAEGMRLCADLLGVSLVTETSTGQLSIHDLVWEFARDVLTSPAVDDLPGTNLTLTEAHRSVIDAYHVRAGRDWARLEDDDYATAHLIWHMQQAGGEQDLHDLLRATRGDRRNVWFELTWERGLATDYVRDVRSALDLVRNTVRGGPDVGAALSILVAHGLTLASALSRIVALPGTMVARLVRSGRWRHESALDSIRLSSDPVRRANAFAALLGVVPDADRARVF